MTAQQGPEGTDRSEHLVRLCNEGRFDELAHAAIAVLDTHPDDGRAMHLLGFARLVLGDVRGALPALERATDVRGDDAQVWDHLGAARNMTGDFAGAATAMARSLEIDPSRAESWVNAAKNRLDLGDPAGAVDFCRKAIRLRPDLADAHNNLSAGLTRIGRSTEALAEAEVAIELAPGLATAHLNRANALKDLGRIDDALRGYDQALTINPALAPAWNNLADTLVKVGDPERALTAAELAYRHAPNDPVVINTLGTLYAVAKRTEEAEALLGRVVAMQPDNAIAWLNLGNVATSEADRAERLAQFERAIAIDPDFEAAMGSLLFSKNYAAGTQPDELLALASRFGRTIARRVSAATSWPNPPDPARTLRVGFVSPDLCLHPVAHFLEGMLMAAQGKGIEWLAYASVIREDEVSERLKPLFSVWRNVAHTPDADLVRQVAEDRVDILIDLAGHTDGNRLAIFAAKPAPVQATWLGYVGTTGLATIDWIIGDPWVFPEGAPSQTIEQPWRLPECYMSFTAPEFDLECGPLPMEGNGYPTFGCFNNLMKVNDEVLALWGRVMAAVPEARLLLRAKQLTFDTERAYMAGRLERAGIPVERTTLEGSLPTRQEAMRQFQRIDIALDPFPYTGATTSAEALWMGVPVLTLRGDRMISRIGESFNMNLGLADWIADSRDDYVARAARFARDPELLARLRRVLRSRGAASPLGNPEWFANQFVAAMRAMWRQWCARQ